VSFLDALSANPSGGGAWSGQHVSIKLQCSSTLVNKKLHPIVRAHYVRKIKRLVHGEMWS